MIFGIFLGKTGEMGAEKGGKNETSFTCNRREKGNWQKKKDMGGKGKRRQTKNFTSVHLQGGSDDPSMV